MKTKIIRTELCKLNIFETPYHLMEIEYKKQTKKVKIDCKQWNCNRKIIENYLKDNWKFLPTNEDLK